MVFVHSLGYLLSTEAGPLTEQMHDNRPTSVSEVQNKEAESSSSQDTATDKQQSHDSQHFLAVGIVSTVSLVQVQSGGQSLKVRLATPFNVCQRPGGVHA